MKLQGRRRSKNVVKLREDQTLLDPFGDKGYMPRKTKTDKFLDKGRVVNRGLNSKDLRSNKSLLKSKKLESPYGVSKPLKENTKKNRFHNEWYAQDGLRVAKTKLNTPQKSLTGTKKSRLKGK